MNIKIVADSSSNLLNLEDANYESVPLKIVTAEQEFSDTPDLNVSDMLEYLKKYKGTTSTSCPNVHDWLEAFKDEGENIHSGDFPAAIVTDIATDPNGTCLEIGTGNPSTIYVVVPIDGELRICVGAVYSFYQFEQPLSNRLTDSEWRQMMGIAATDKGLYNYDTAINPPEWTQSYRYE